MNNNHSRETSTAFPQLLSWWDNIALAYLTPISILQCIRIVTLLRLDIETLSALLIVCEIFFLKGQQYGDAYFIFVFSEKFVNFSQIDCTFFPYFEVCILKKISPDIFILTPRIPFVVTFRRLSSCPICHGMKRRTFPHHAKDMRMCRYLDLCYRWYRHRYPTPHNFYKNFSRWSLPFLLLSTWYMSFLINLYKLTFWKIKNIFEYFIICYSTGHDHPSRQNRHK